MNVKQFVTLVAALAMTTAGCQIGHNLPPASRLLEPGPGVGGPGPGVIPPPGADAIDPAMGGPSMMGGPIGGAAADGDCPTCAPGGGVVSTGYSSSGPACLGGGGFGGMVVQRTVQALFAEPESMQLQWDVTGQNNFESEPLIVPGRQNFSQAGVYRLKLTNITGFEGVELYPTLEIGPVTPRTHSFLAHSAIPVSITQDDFAQVMAGNHVVKVIYLPDPEFQVLAVAGGVGTLVSTKLSPGEDPIVEADQRGAIMAILRVGNLDIEALAAAGEPAFVGGAIPGAGPAFPAPAGPSVPPAYISGITTQSYGMPWTGTPIGLPGPPHIPMSTPAGLRSHWMRNSTPHRIPQPVRNVGITVSQQPGYSYPAPANRVRIREQNIHPSLNYRQPRSQRNQLIKP